MQFYKEQYANINTHKKKKNPGTKLYYPIATWQQKKKTEKRVDDINIFFFKTCCWSAVNIVGKPITVLLLMRERGRKLLFFTERNKKEKFIYKTIILSLLFSFWMNNVCARSKLYLAVGYYKIKTLNNLAP